MIAPKRMSSRMSFKSALRDLFGLRATLISAFVPMVLLLTAEGATGAAPKPTTVAEIALYQGADREQFLIEGAKKKSIDVL